MSSKRRNSRFRKNPEFSEKEWEALLSVLKWCQRCGSEFDLTKDHIIPVSKGGKNTLDNIQVLCYSCNRKKADRKLPNHIPRLLLPSQEAALVKLPYELQTKIKEVLRLA